MNRHHLATFTASLDPSALAFLGIVGAQVWGALT